MQSHRRQRFVSATPTVCRSQVDAFVTSTWPGQTRMVADNDGMVTFAITADPGDAEGEVWLTWRLTAQGDGTLLDLVLDEVDDGPDVGDELDLMLDVVTRASRYAAPK